MKKIYKLNELKNIEIDFKCPNIIFLFWDLWAGKTTISKHIINNLLWFPWNVKSPTYTYYNKYIGNTKCHCEWNEAIQSSISWIKTGLLRTSQWQSVTIHHFDLYRLKNYDEFFAIGWEEILDNNEWIILVEWPEILEGYYNADMIIKMKKVDIEDEREIEILEN
jgi:tRNA threonylcarbamoyladenosine biosynthesis protein TsaE